MNKLEWKVKYDGKLDLVIFCFVATFAICLLFTSRQIMKDNGDFLETFLLIPVFLFPITAAVVWVTLSMARKKKVPRSISIDKEKQLMDISFFNEKKHAPYQLELDDIAFEWIERSFFTVLVLYNKSTATRGHLLYFSMFSIFSLSISTSWNKRIVFEIINALKELDVEIHHPQKKKPIVDHILG